MSDRFVSAHLRNMTDEADLKEAILRGLRKCRHADAPVPLIREDDLGHITHMVLAEVLAALATCATCDGSGTTGLFTRCPDCDGTGKADQQDVQSEVHPCGDWPAPCNHDDPETHDSRGN